jgi:hypothetical protein
VNRQTPIILVAIFLAFILTHDTAVTGSMHSTLIATGADGIAAMHPAHVTRAPHQNPHRSPSPGCDTAPAVVNDPCVTAPAASGQRPDSDRGAAPLHVSAILRGRDPQLPWTQTHNIHTVSGGVRRALLQVFQN